MEIQQNDTSKKIKWVKKEDFNPIEGEWYWVIIPNQNTKTGFFVPYPAMFKDGYYCGETENELIELDNEKISHVSKIVYPFLK
jgi:hypothetical protein